MRRWASLLAASALLAPAQQQAPFQFTTHAWLVVEAVTVTNQRGEPVTGLTAKDFRVTEDGAPQQIAFCDFQKLDGAAPPAAAPAAPAAPSPRASAPNVTSVQIAPVQHPDRRLVALYFDMTAMPTSDQLRALQAAQRFIASDLRPADLVAVMSYAGTGVKVNLDFTDDRAALGKALGDLTLGALGYDENSADAATSDYGSAFGQDDSEFNIFNTNRQLAALQTAVDMLGTLNARKSLVYFASGLNLRGVDNQAQLEATTNAAIRANVALFPVDARGLVASAPLGDATQGSPGGAAMYNGGAAAAFNQRLQSSQDTLYALGSDTGGKALLDTNNLGRGIAQARDAIASYYLIGYYTSNPALDGKYRKVRVALAPQFAAAKLAYRTGYYAGKAFAKFTTADKERQLEDALLLGDPITDLTLELEVNYFQLNSAEYFVPIAAKIPGSELALAKKGGAQQAVIDFIGEVKDAYGTTITNLRDKITLKLSGSTAAQLARTPLEYTAGFTLLPGQYSIKLLARDDQTGRIGTYLKQFTIPNLMRAAALPISSVVLSDQRVAVNAALFNANKSLTDDPLVENGSELMPSVTRVFRRDAPIYLYLQAYEHPPATPHAAGAYVSFYRQGKLAYASAIVVPAVAPQGRAGAIPIALTVPAGTLAPGRYTCQVVALDAATQHAAVWRAPLEVR